MDEWKKIDLHIHTKEGNVYNNGNEATDTGKYYNLENLYSRNKINELNLISITNHNLIEVVEILRAAYVSKFSDTTVLPGAELDVIIASDRRYHIIVIFSETTDIMKVSLRLSKMLDDNGNNYLTLENLFELITGTECIIIPHACKKPHGFKHHNGEEVNLADAEDILNIITSSSSLNVLFEHTQPHFKESFKDSILNQANQKWFSEEEIVELKNRIETEYTASDYRFNWPVIEKETRLLPKIWASASFRGLQLACMFHKNRLKAENKILNKNNYIKKIVIEDSNSFYKSEIDLSSGLNSIIGESASGKTALLDIVTTNLKGTNAVTGKNYNSLYGDLKVAFYNQNGFELKLDDVNIHIAKNLYDAIKTAHDKEDNTSILKLFNFKEITECSTLAKYEKNIVAAAQHYKKLVIFESDIKKDLDNIEERSKTLIKNSDAIMDKLIVNVPADNITGNYNEVQKLDENIKKYKSNLEILRENYETIKYQLSNLGIEHKIVEFHQELEKEVNRVASIIMRKELILKYKCTVLNKLTYLINNLNNTVNQKNAYINSTKLKLHNELDELKTHIKNYYINKTKYNNSNLDFPGREIKAEMKKKNFHSYIEIDYTDFDTILKVDENNGIINVKGCLRIVDKYRFKKVDKNSEIKEIIELLIQNDKPVSVLTSDLLSNIVKKSKIKIGFPGEQKIELSELTPGLTAKLYIDYMFNVEIENGTNNIVIFDQPENDVDKEFIYNELIPKFDITKFNLQIIITSHEPLLVINGDTNQIIKAEKKSKKIKYTSYKLDEYLDKNTITSVIAKYIDGSVTAVKNRYEIYIGGMK